VVAKPFIAGFYINLPIGACAAVLVLFHAIPDTNGMDAFSFAFVRRTLSSLDLGGFALLAPAMAMFLAALQFGSDTKYAWNSSLIIGLFCGAGVAAVLFVLWECRVGDTAIIPGSVVRRREVWSSCGHIFSMSFVVFIANYFLPVYFQAVKGVGPTLSGLYLLPGILGQLSFVLLSGAAGKFILATVTPELALELNLCSIETGLFHALVPLRRCYDCCRRRSDDNIRAQHQYRAVDWLPVDARYWPRCCDDNGEQASFPFASTTLPPNPCRLTRVRSFGSP
jgi:hypothetical protein